MAPAAHGLSVIPWPIDITTTGARTAHKPVTPERASARPAAAEALDTSNPVAISRCSGTRAASLPLAKEAATNPMMVSSGFTLAR